MIQCVVPTVYIQYNIYTACGTSCSLSCLTTLFYTKEQHTHTHMQTHAHTHARMHTHAHAHGLCVDPRAYRSFIVCRYMCICKYVFLLLTPSRRMVSKRRERGRERGHLTPPLKFNQTQCLLPQGRGRMMMIPSWGKERWT